MAAWTSRAAALTSRSSSNCSVIEVDPSVLLEVISVTPAMRLRLLSRGVATAEAIVSGLAPGRFALTEIVGNSTCGRGATGSMKYPRIPARVIASVRSVVPTGLRIKNSEKFDPLPIMQVSPLNPATVIAWMPTRQTTDRSPEWYRASGLG